MISTRNHVSLHDIAKVARVSISTVSRALSKDTRVSPKTRKRIIAIAQVLESRNYATNNRVRTPFSENTIAIVQPERNIACGGGNTEISVCVLENVQDTIEPAGGNVISVRLKEYKGHSWMDCIRQAKGLIGFGLRDEDAGRFISAARTSGLPFVLLNRTDSDSSVPVCSTDHVQAGRLAAMHLSDYGHERVGLIFNSLDIQSSQQRLSGIREIFKARNIQLDPTCIFSDINTPEAAGDALETLTKEFEVSAIVSAHDRMAKMILTEALKRKISIPDDVSLISFDGSEDGAFLHPALTSVYTPWAEMAKMAGQMLLWMIKDHLLCQAKMVWTPRLILRNSTAKLL